MTIPELTPRQNDILENTQQNMDTHLQLEKFVKELA